MPWAGKMKHSVPYACKRSYGLIFWNRCYNLMHCFHFHPISQLIISFDWRCWMFLHSKVELRACFIFETINEGCKTLHSRNQGRFTITMPAQPQHRTMRLPKLLLEFPARVLNLSATQADQNNKIRHQTNFPGPDAEQPISSSWYASKNNSPGITDSFSNLDCLTSVWSDQTRPFCQQK